MTSSTAPAGKPHKRRKTRSKAPWTPSRKINKLKDVSEIRRYFHRNETPVFFISATNFNLLGLDDWCRNFKFINHIDCYDGRHPNTFVPTEQAHPEFESIEDINAYLLENKEVIDFIKVRGGKPKAVFLMFDERVESICQELGIEVLFPSAALRSGIDDKIETVRIGNKAGVPSAPNVLSEVDSWQQLQRVSKSLGKDLVLQSAFGDSGHTTFFIRSERDFRRHQQEIVGQGPIKIMQRLKCRGSAIEACRVSAGNVYFGACGQPIVSGFYLKALNRVPPTWLVCGRICRNCCLVMKHWLSWRVGGIWRLGCCRFIVRRRIFQVVLRRFGLAMSLCWHAIMITPRCFVTALSCRLHGTGSVLLV